MKLQKLSAEEIRTIAHDCAKNECIQMRVAPSDAQRYVERYTEAFSRTIEEFNIYTAKVDKEG